MRYDVLAEKTDEETLARYYKRCSSAFKDIVMPRCTPFFSDAKLLFETQSTPERKMSKYEIAIRLHVLSKVVPFDSLEGLEIQLAVRGA